MFKQKQQEKGFTLIELLVVIAIIGILSSVVLASLNSARVKARDANRLSDIKQMTTIIALETGVKATPITGCITADDDVADCTGSFSQLAEFSDPSGTTPCTGTSPTAVCQYSISQADGDAAATTEDYEICFVTEDTTALGPAGAYSAESPSGNITTGCSI